MRSFKFTRNLRETSPWGLLRAKVQTASGSQADKSRETPPVRGQSVQVSSLVHLKTENSDVVGGREIF